MQTKCRGNALKNGKHLNSYVEKAPGILSWKARNILLE